MRNFSAPIILKTKMDISEKLILFDFVHMQCDYNYYFLFLVKNFEHKVPYCREITWFTIAFF